MEIVICFTWSPCAQVFFFECVERWGNVPYSLTQQLLSLHHIYCDQERVKRLIEEHLTCSNSSWVEKFSICQCAVFHAPPPQSTGYAIDVTSQHRELRKAIIFQKAVMRSVCDFLPICDFVSRMVYSKECHKKEGKLPRTAVVSILNLRTSWSGLWTQ